MSRSISNVKIISVLVAKEFSNAISRRGFAVAAAKTASEGSVSSGTTAVLKKNVGEESSQKEVAWIPDPKTGYYRPETGSDEIDPAELRAILLNNKQ